MNWQEQHILETEKPQASFPILNWNCIQAEKKKYNSKKLNNQTNKKPTKKTPAKNPRFPKKPGKASRTDEQKGI